MNKILELSHSHFKRILREPFLTFIFLLPFLIGLIFRILIPMVQPLLISYFNLAEYYPLIMTILVLLTPILFGWVIGFSLLDDRDEKVLDYLSITPLQKSGYLKFKVIAPVLISIFQAYLVLLIANLCPMDYLKLLPLILIAAMETPLFALGLGAFADNKVEGLAIGKLMGLVMMAPIISYFIDSPLAYIAALLPPFWITESYFSTGNYYWISLIIGLVVHLFWIFYMVKLFNDRQG